MEPTLLVLVVLAAVALGALLPLVVQMTLTFRAARMLIKSTGPRLDGAIDELTAAAGAARRSMDALDAAALQRTADGVAEIGKLARKAGDLTATIELATALGAAAAPAVATIIRAWRSPDETAEDASEVNSNLHNQRMDQP